VAGAPATVDENADEVEAASDNVSLNFAAPAVSVDKRLVGGVKSVVIGETVSYTIVVSNTGNTTITQLPLVDEFPAGLEFVSATVAPSSVVTSTAGGTLSWSDLASGTGGLQPGHDTTVTATFKALSAGAVANTARVTGAEDASGYPVPAAEDTDSGLSVSGQPMPVLRKSANPPAGTILMPGDIITYTLAFENPTQVAMTDVQVADVVPETVGYVPGSMALDLGGSPVTLTDGVDADAGRYTSASRTVALTLPTLAAGSSGRLTFRVTVLPDDISRPGVFNSFTFAHSGGVNVRSNEVTHPVDPWDIEKVAKDVNGGRLKSGDVIEWRITVRNTGLVQTTQVVVTDALPEGISYVPGSITGKGANDDDPRVLVWNIGIMPVGGVEVLTLKTTVDSGVRAGTTIANRAIVDSAETDPKSSDDPRTAAVGDSTMLRTGDNDWLWLSAAIALLLGGSYQMGRRAAVRQRVRPDTVTARSRRRSRARRHGVAGMTLLVAGIAIVLLANAAEVGFELRRAGLVTIPSAKITLTNSTRSAQVIAQLAEKNASHASGNRVTIPALGIMTPVGTSEKSSLANGAYLHAGSARPGEPGNTVLAGHRRSDVFSLLHRAEVGDEVVVHWKGTAHRYLIAEKHTAKPTDTSWLARGGRDRLTIYTCLPRFMGNKRTVVVAYPLGETAVAQAAR
jgi:LPXTG-site transpeptidase (sortase) family protein